VLQGLDTLRGSGAKALAENKNFTAALKALRHPKPSFFSKL
jgi:hypothetical protein